MFVPVMKHHLADVAEVGGDIPDVVARHNPMATFASRGCDVGCWFCIVPKMEGNDFTEIDDFPVRPILCDNNLSGLDLDFQRHIVRRYVNEDVPLLDANSGFEPRKFDEEVRAIWEPVLKGPWRFALDDMGDMPHVERMMGILQDVSPKRKQVYTLIGNEPFEACLERIRKVIEWGGEPYAQPVMKLNAKARVPWVRHDWNMSLLKQVQRWCNRHIWRYADFPDYVGGKKTPPEPDPDQLTFNLPQPKENQDATA